jgi:hypothetical protein
VVIKRALSTTIKTDAKATTEDGVELFYNELRLMRENLYRQRPKPQRATFEKTLRMTDKCPERSLQVFLKALVFESKFPECRCLVSIKEANIVMFRLHMLDDRPTVICACEAFILMLQSLRHLQPNSVSYEILLKAYSAYGRMGLEKLEKVLAALPHHSVLNTSLYRYLYECYLAESKCEKTCRNVR